MTTERSDRSDRWTLTFEPLSVLMFRDHRPFDAGQHSLALSQFPMPSVFRGAVRTALFRAAKADFRRASFGLDDRAHAVLGCKDVDEAFELQGPFMLDARKRDQLEYMLPWPADLFASKRDDNDRVWLLQAHEREQPHASRSLRLGAPNSKHERVLEELSVALPWHAHQHGKPCSKTRWLTSEGARLYTEAGTEKLELEPDVHWVDQDDFMRWEPRVGIARATEDSDRLVAAESMLYTLQTWRLREGIRFAVEIDFCGLEGDELGRLQELLSELDGTLVRLGGRSQHARVELTKRSLAPTFAEREPTANTPHKLWLWTPALFEPGALAQSPQGLRGALAKRIRVGGFNMARRCPRPLLGGLDKGAVLWFRDPDARALREHQHDYTTKHEHASARGYGHGAWIPTSSTSTSQS